MRSLGRQTAGLPIAMSLDHNVPIALTDGVVTSADIWRPSRARPLPTILIRTPYGKETHFHMSPIDPRTAIERGYNMVIQDVRGRGGSNGTFTPFTQERQDGHDTIDWISAQSWSDGQVVMTGPSYVGATQWLAAQTHPVALKAIAPLNSSDSFGNGFAFTNGVREHGFLTSWVAASLGLPELQRHDAIAAGDADPFSLAALVPEVDRWFTTEADDEYWAAVSVGPDRSSIDIPVLSVGGWYDIFLRGTLHAYQARNDPRDRLIIGAWAHDNYFSHLVGPRNLGYSGSGEAVGLGEMVLDFFDDALAEQQSNLPPVSAFVLGTREWADFRTWPPPNNRVLSYPLATGTIEVDADDLPQSTGGRALRVGVPGGGWGPTDQSALLSRPDTLVTTVGFPDSEVTLGGPAWVSLTADEPRKTRLWVCLLCTRSDDGALDIVADGVARQDSSQSAVHIPLGDILINVAKGTELVLIVCGGYFPRWDPTTEGGSQSVLSPSTLILTQLLPD